MKHIILFFALFTLGCRNFNAVYIDSGDQLNPHPILYKEGSEWLVAATMTCGLDLATRIHKCNECHSKNNIPIIKSLEQDYGRLFKIQFEKNNENSL